MTVSYTHLDVYKRQAEKGYDPVFGARPLKRYLQRQIETRLARGLISGTVAEGSTVTFSVKDGEWILS